MGLSTALRSVSGQHQPTGALVVPRGSGNDPPRTCIFNEHSLGNNNVLKLKLLGAIGVRRNESMVGCMIGPPAESEYAVDPVGVARMSPSACCNPNPKTMSESAPPLPVSSQQNIENSRRPLSNADHSQTHLRRSNGGTFLYAMPPHS
jgi:hypothetical protein